MRGGFTDRWPVLFLWLFTCFAVQGQKPATLHDLVEKHVQTATFEIRGPSHLLTQDVPFVVTVLADATPAIVRQLEERSRDGVAAPEGFTELDVWNGAIHFHEAGRHLGSDAASCTHMQSSRDSSAPRAKGLPEPRANWAETLFAAVGAKDAAQSSADDAEPAAVRQIGPVRFGLYATRLRTSIAWQATMIVTRSGRYSVEAIPAIAPPAPHQRLAVEVASQWPEGLTRALLLSLLVIAAAVLVVTPGRLLPLSLVAAFTATLAYHEPAFGGHVARVVAVALPIAGALLASFKRKTLLDLMMVRHSGVVPDKAAAKVTPPREERARLAPHAAQMADAAKPAASTTATAAPTLAPAVGDAAKTAGPPQPVADTTAQAAPLQASEPGADAPAAAEPETTLWQRVVHQWHAFRVWLRGPVTREDVVAQREEPPAPALPDKIVAAAPARPARTEERNLPDPEALRKYKAGADLMVAAAEHRAQWQLVIGGAAGLAAVVFLLKASMTFGHVAIAGARTDQSIMPTIVRLLPYLLCFGSLLLAAAFLLRQYRSSLDDFRHFVRNQRLRESQLVAVEAARFISSEDDVARKTIDILGWGEGSGSKERDSSARDSAGSGTSAVDPAS